jgi:hypothetical protein
VSGPEAVELRCRRPFFRFAAGVLPQRPGRGWLTLLMLIGSGLVLAMIWLIVAGALGGRVAVLYPLAALLLVLPALVWIPALVTGSWWRLAGAGEPMLRIADGQVAGRVRPVLPGGEDEPVPGSAQWWDFVVPAREIRAVRVSWQSLVRPALVLDLPAAVADELAARPELRSAVADPVRRLQSPAVWWVGMYEPRSARRRRLEELLAALSAAGAPAGSPGSAG